MACGSRIYKGGDMVMSFPFNVDEYSDVSLRIYTDGEYSIEKVESGMTIADGQITVVIEDYELELLKEGVVKYTLNYTHDGLQLTETTNTPYVLKAPAGYSAQTPGEIYQRGYEDGLDACEHPEMYVQDKKIDVDGSWSGHETFYPDSGYVGMSSLEVNAYDYGEARYHAGKDDQKALLESLSATTNGTYNSINGWSSVTVNVKPELQSAGCALDAAFYEQAREAYIYPEGRYEGLSRVHVYDNGLCDYVYSQGEAGGKALIKDAARHLTVSATGTYTVDESVDIPRYYKSVTVKSYIYFSGTVEVVATDLILAGLLSPIQASGQSDYSYVVIDSDGGGHNGGYPIAAGTHTIVVVGGRGYFGNSISPGYDDGTFFKWTSMGFWMD